MQSWDGTTSTRRKHYTFLSWALLACITHVYVGYIYTLIHQFPVPTSGVVNTHGGIIACDIFNALYIHSSDEVYPTTSKLFLDYPV